MSIAAKRPAVKRGSNVTPVKVTTKQIEIIKYDKYRINSDDEGDINDIIEVLRDYIDEGMDINLELNRRSIFQTDIQQLPHCCGIFELGSIGFEPFKDDIKFFNALAICKKGKTLMINTINTGQSNKLAVILAKCSNWTLVKTFTNSGSGNTIKIWMSNNN